MDLATDALARLSSALKVVEAAKVWRAGYTEDWTRALTADGRRTTSPSIDLIAAVDEHQKQEGTDG